MPPLEQSEGRSSESSRHAHAQQRGCPRRPLPTRPRGGPTRPGRETITGPGIRAGSGQVASLLTPGPCATSWPDMPPTAGRSVKPTLGVTALFEAFSAAYLGPDGCAVRRRHRGPQGIGFLPGRVRASHSANLRMAGRPRWSQVAGRHTQPGSLRSSAAGIQDLVGLP